MTSRLSLLLLLCLVQLSWIQAVRVKEKEQEILDTILSKYDTRIRPTGGSTNATGDSEPTTVTINMFVRMIEEVDDKNMEYSVQVTLRQSWEDDRLKFESEGINYLSLIDKSKLWIPDLFFSNEKEAHEHNLVTPNMYFRIFPDGKVLYSTRLSMTLSCPMNLKRFPFDMQVCSMRMASYGYTTEDVVFLWKEGDPVQIVKNLQIPLFSLDSFDTDYCNSKTNTGEYSCVKVDLLFSRDVTYYLVNLFIPSAMLVLVSWISFWLDREAITARAIVGVATLLAAAAHSCVFNSKTAVVTYTRAVDVWMGVCLTFLFAALVETVIVNYMSRREAKKLGCCGETAVNKVESGVTDEEAMKPLVDQPEEVIPKEENGSPSKFRLKERASGLRARFAKISTCSKRLDILARILFPVVFVMFEICFIVYYYV